MSPENATHAERVFPKAAEVARQLRDAFWWDETPEGSDFWLDIYEKLLSLAVPHCPTCGAKRRAPSAAPEESK